MADFKGGELLHTSNGSHLCELHNCYWDFH
jgi:hypothetical protein